MFCLKIIFVNSNLKKHNSAMDIAHNEFSIIFCNVQWDCEP